MRRETQYLADILEARMLSSASSTASTEKKFLQDEVLAQSAVPPKAYSDWEAAATFAETLQG